MGDLTSLSLLRYAPTALLICLVSWLAHRAFCSPLRNIPGPLIACLTSLWTYYHSYIGNECTKINELHRRYGPVVRIAPNEVSISDGTALAPIYAEKGGFMKAPCYANFDIEGHSTIFSTRDPAHRAVRSKAVVPCFSMTSIRARQSSIEDTIASMIDRLKSDAVESKNEGKPVNVLNLTRSLALDAVSSYLFGITFGAISENTAKLSAASFVDALVAVGRFFFLPNSIFLALETVRAKFTSDEENDESAHEVDNYVNKLLEDGQKGDLTYQDRLLKAGISRHEVEVQCKDLIFAATDSTGTNAATTIWNLARHPEVYEQLRTEIAAADAEDPAYIPQSLPYLDAVVREGLRVSMANPARFPRTVPPQGFSFEASDGKRYFLPGGTQVGIQPYTLHFNPAVFADPFAFKPERWLENPMPEMRRDWIPFGLGSRQCIARNLAMTELFLAVRAIARENVLAGAEAVGDKIRYLEWFNSRIKGEKIELIWR